MSGVKCKGKGGIWKCTCTPPYSEEHFTPLYHQKFVRQYLKITQHKGLILYHKLGSGKTCTSILSSDFFLQAAEPYERAFIITPGSLRENFAGEYCNVCGKNSELLKKKYTFITYNTDIVDSLPEDFENSFVIIDEFHNWTNMLKNAFENNSGKSALEIYKRLVSADRIKILLLSGTPIYNNPYEVGIIVNLLNPRAFVGIVTRKGMKFKLNTEAFYKFFDKSEDGEYTPKNPRVVKKLLSGVCSYVAGIDESLYPKTIYHEAIKCPMSKEQAKIVRVAMDNEAKFGRDRPDRDLIRTDPQLYSFLEIMYILSKLNRLSRPPSNFMYPPSVISPIEQTLGDDDDDDLGLVQEKVTPKVVDLPQSKGGWINKDMFGGNLGHYSAKFLEIMRKVRDNFFQKHVMFSYMKTRSGVMLMSSLLNMCGISTAIYSGDVSMEDRSEILRVFNSPENEGGKIIKVLLITDAGAEGITILACQNIHILESDKRENKIRQVIGRVARYKSHMILPPEDRYVNVWRYWSVFDKPFSFETEVQDMNGQVVVKKYDVTSDTKAPDQYIYETSLKILVGIESITNLLVEYSIENEFEKENSVTL